jgi:hypothetical protein
LSVDLIHESVFNDNTPLIVVLLCSVVKPDTYNELLIVEALLKLELPLIFIEPLIFNIPLIDVLFLIL